MSGLCNLRHSLEPAHREARSWRPALGGKRAVRPTRREVRIDTEPVPERTKKLGQLLIERGQASGGQVMRAILSQRTAGGRLGTCLLELEAVDEDQLLETLAVQQGAPAARAEALRAIPDEIVHLIPSRVAVRCSAVPFSASDKEVHVATVDTRDLKILDELAFCTSRRIRAHVASEVRIREALSKYYGAECPRRFSRLIDRLNRVRYLWSEKGAGGEAEPSPDTSAAPWTHGPFEMQWSDPEEAFGTTRRQAGPRAKPGPARTK